MLLLSATAILAFLGWRSLCTARWGMSECLQWQGMSLSDRFIIQDQKNKELTAMIDEFAQKIAAGSVSPQRGFAVLRAFYKGPVVLALLHSSIVNHIYSLEFSENTDLQSIEKTSLQFFLGVKSGKIPAADEEIVQEMLMEEKVCETTTSIGFIVPEQIKTFKKKIGLKDLFDCLAKMNQANNAAGLVAGIIDGEATLDPIVELRTVLQKL